MDPIRDKGGGSDLPTHTNAVDRYQFVAHEADHARCQNPAEILQGLGLEEPTDRFDGGHDRGEGDHRNDEQPRQVLGTPVPERVAARRSPSAQQKRYP